MQANLAEALRVLGRPREALEHLRRAQAIDPALAQIWNTRGLIAYDPGGTPTPRPPIARRSRASHGSTAAHINLANALQALHRRSTRRSRPCAPALSIEP